MRDATTTPAANFSSNPEGGLAAVRRFVFAHRMALGVSAAVPCIVLAQSSRTARRPAALATGAGLTLFVAGLLLRAWAAAHAGRHTRSARVEAERLVTTGPYAHVRNPIYLGTILLALGTVLSLGNRLLAMAGGVILVGLYANLIPAEEAYLKEKFPQEYDAYRRKVGRLIPKVRPWRRVKTATVDWHAARGEWRVAAAALALVALARWGVPRSAFRVPGSA